MFDEPDTAKALKELFQALAQVEPFVEAVNRQYFLIHVFFLYLLIRF